MNEPLVSIIVPVYNTDPSLLKLCLDSIVNQTYENMEIIIVDDGSQQDTKDYLKEYVESLTIRKDTVKIITQENKGLSGARNTGYAAANGEYVQFLDSDDLFNERLISRVVGKAEALNADIVVENFTVKDYASNTEVDFFTGNPYPSKKTFTLWDIEFNKLEAVPYNVWSKLFKKSFLDKYMIKHDEELVRAEDVLFTYSCLLRAERIAFEMDPLMIYRENLPSSNTQTNDRFPNMSIIAWRKAAKLIQDEGVYDELQIDFEYALLHSVYWHLGKLKTDEGRKKLAQSAIELFSDIKLVTINDYRIGIELALRDFNMWLHVDEKNIKIDALEAKIGQLEAKTKELNDTLYALKYPTMKVALRKVLGVTKRKIVGAKEESR